MSLAALQGDFAAWLSGADPAAAAHLPLADPRGLAIYQSNYRGALLACLTESFPHTHAWLGDEGFTAAAAGYIAARPPTGWTLDGYGAGFPAFLGAAWPDDPEVAELAALELRLGECFIAPDAEAITPAALAATDWASAELRLVPSASLLAPRSNAPAIWSALAAGTPPPPPAVGEAAAPLVVWRQGYGCCWRPLAADERALFPALLGGIGFAALCASLVAERGEAAGITAAGTLLARWAGEALLRAIPA